MEDNFTEARQNKFASTVQMEVSLERPAGIASVREKHGEYVDNCEVAGDVPIVEKTFNDLVKDINMKME